MQTAPSIRPPLVVALLVCFLAISAASSALTLYSGQDHFYVRVTNSYFKTINMARGNVWVSGNQARIEVQADGYRNGYTYVRMNANTHSYSCDVRLDDPSVNVRIKDNEGQYIKGAYANNYSQSLYWGDEYGVRGSLPVAGFEKLTERELEVRVNYMWPFAPRVYLGKSGDQWRFEVIVKRRDLDRNFNNIDLIFTKDKPASDAVEPSISDLVADLHDNQALVARLTSDEDLETVQTRLDSLNRRIRNAYSAMDAGERNTFLGTLLSRNSGLAKDLQTMDTFATLHR